MSGTLEKLRISGKLGLLILEPSESWDINIIKSITTFAGSMQPRKTALQVFSPSATLEGAIANQWTQSFSSEKCSNAASQLHESAPPRRSISLYGKPCINYLHLVLLFSEIMLSSTHCYKPPFLVPKVELQKILNNFFDKKTKVWNSVQYSGMVSNNKYFIMANHLNGILP